MRLYSPVLVMLAVPFSASAQPYSQSMAQCGGITAALLAYVETQERRDILERMSDQWLAAATEQARAEGVKKAETVVEAQFNEMREEWEGKGAMIVFSSDLKDWMSYCRKFAKDRGIDLSQG